VKSLGQAKRAKDTIRKIQVTWNFGGLMRRKRRLQHLQPSLLIINYSYFFRGLGKKLYLCNILAFSRQYKDEEIRYYMCMGIGGVAEYAGTENLF
jgi:hypothetical protein